MKRFYTFLLIGMSMALALTSCGMMKKHQYQDKYIKVFDSPRSENFTNEQLTNLMRQPDYMPSIVVRNLSATSTSVSSNASTHRLCSILEMGLAKNGMDVRDRSLFDNVLASMNQGGGIVDYSNIYKATQVDLLLEISSYDLDIPFLVDKYYVGNNSYHFPEEIRIVNGKKTGYIPTYILRGMSLTIKVIMLQNNLIGGTYSFTYVPCSAEKGGALITQLSPLRYRPAGNNRDIDAVLNDDNSSGRAYTSNERLDHLMEDYITHSVVPEMVAFMKGENPVIANLNVEQNNTTGTNLNNNTVAQNEPSGQTLSLNNAVDPIYSISESKVQELKATLLSTGRGSEEVEQLIQTQIGINNSVLQNPLLSKQITTRLKNKEKLITELINETSEKKIDNLNDKIANLNASLARLNYYDFNDYSYIVSNNKGESYKVKSEQVASTENVRKPDSKDKTNETQKIQRNVQLINSYGDNSDAISSMILMNFSKQSSEETAVVKKDKLEEKQAELDMQNSDVLKLKYLTGEKRSEINNFINSSSYAVGNVAPSATDNVVMFMPSSETELENDAIYIFLDGKCIGSGTSNNGFYISIPSSEAGDGFHELIILSSPKDNGKIYSELFSSSVMFKIKKDYVFNKTLKSKKLTTLTIQ